jgi:hypothetical protein
VHGNLVKKKQHGCMITTLGLLLNYFLDRIIAGVVVLYCWKPNYLKD